MLAFNLRSPLFRDGAQQSFDLYIIVKRGHSDVNKKHFRVPLTNIFCFKEHIQRIWEELNLHAIITYCSTKLSPGLRHTLLQVLTIPICLHIQKNAKKITFDAFDGNLTCILGSYQCSNLFSQRNPLTLFFAKIISFRSSGDIDSFRAFLCPPIPILPL